jgi:hypothetical protein
MTVEAKDPAIPRSALCVLVPWFVFPVLASPLAVLLIEQGAGAVFGLDRTSFRAVSLAMLSGYFEIWTLATLTGVVAGWMVHRREGVKRHASD